MGNERYPRNSDPQGDYYGRTDPQDYGRDDGAGRDYSYSSAQDYRASGYGEDRDRSGGRDRVSGRPGYGARDYGHPRYVQRDQPNNRPDADRDPDRSDTRYARQAGGDADRDRDYGRSGDYHGSYASGGRRFEEVGRYAHGGDNTYRGGGERDGGRSYGRPQQGYGRPPQGYDYDERGFLARAGDEVRSWFGDEDAERRRDMDSRQDERAYDHRDHDYHSWRRGQIDALDRDYDEYRREHRSKFENDFSSWRTSRQGQREALNKVEEHMDVVGSDGEHVGTVDKVRGDCILLTRNDADARGRHHSIPSGWISTVADKVTLAKSAADAKRAWRDEERNQAMFGDDTGRGDTAKTQAGSSSAAGGEAAAESGGNTLNRSVSRPS